MDSNTTSSIELCDESILFLSRLSCFGSDKYHLTSLCGTILSVIGLVLNFFTYKTTLALSDQSTRYNSNLLSKRSSRYINLRFRL